MQLVKGYPRAGMKIAVEDLAQPPHKRWVVGEVMSHPRKHGQPYVTRFRTGLVACAIQEVSTQKKKWVPWTSDTNRVRYWIPDETNPADLAQQFS